MAIINSSDLDFDTIKTKLKTYFEQQSEFADYNFEASGLSNILDVLAYNTHLNGLIANFSLNESFLSTAQLRSNVVGHAEMLGYSPRSTTSAKATVNVLLTNTAISRASTISLPAYTQFNSIIDDNSYTFYTLEEYLATDDGSGNYNFVNQSGSTSLQIYEGKLKTKTFIVGDTTDGQIYVIPDTKMDTKTLTVDVYDTYTGSSFTTYKDINQVVRINSTSTVYQIKEVPNGYYELVFGDGSVLGSAPKPGNKIVISYLAPSGALANDGDEFSAANDYDFDGIDFPLYVTAVTNSTGGAEKESVDSIRSNAPKAFASQQRMVTAEDYESQILLNYSSFITDVVAWGGHDNVPPVYGRVYVGLKFIDGIDDNQKKSIKDSIVTNLTKNLAVMSIDTVFADPTEVYLELTTVFNFDPSLTNITVRAAESQVVRTIDDYFTNNLKKFDQIFRRSNLLTSIDDISPAILNSRMDVKLQIRLDPSIGIASNYSIAFPVVLADADDRNYIITTSKFQYLGQTCTIRNKLNTTDLEIVNLIGDVILDNTGSYSPQTGKVELISFAPEYVVNDLLKISAVPANQSTIKPLRNYIIDIDAGASSARAVIDYRNTKVTL